MPANDSFHTTSWSLILAAREEGQDQRAALEKLCRAYHEPVLAYVRRHAFGRDEADDLTQSFFLRFLEQRFDADAVPERGRFRVYLLATLKHFLSNAQDYAKAVKRGGRAHAVALDDADMPGSDPAESPERTFERVWAFTVLSHAIERMRNEAASAGKQTLFNTLEEFLLEVPEPAQYPALAEQLNMDRNAIAVTVHRMRERLKERVRAELAETVSDPKAIDGELRVLRDVLAAS